MDWCLLLEYFPSLFFICVKRIKTVLGCWAENVVLSCPHWTGNPTQLALGVGRGKICTKDLTCDFCVGWSLSQGEAFAKKRIYKERKRSSPSGSLPPATKTSPRAGTSSEVLHLDASSSLPSGGQAKKGGSWDAPGAASREASSPPTRRSATW